MQQILLRIPGTPIKVHGFGLMLAIALIASIQLAAWRARREKLDGNAVFDLSIWVLVCGLIGARALFVLEYGRGFAHWWQVFEIWNGGIVFYGCIVGGVVGAILYHRLRPFPFRPMMDAIAPALALGIALGRVGCFFNGCCYGDICDPREIPWAVTFPAKSTPFDDQVRLGELSATAERSRFVHPTQLYSSLDGLVLLGVLTAFYPLRTRDGQVMGLLMLGYPITRFLIEQLRSDEPGLVGGLTISQAISVGLFGLGVAWLAYLQTRPPGRYADGAPPMGHAAA